MTKLFSSNPLIKCNHSLAESTEPAAMTARFCVRRLAAFGSSAAWVVTCAPATATESISGTRAMLKRANKREGWRRNENVINQKP